MLLCVTLCSAAPSYVFGQADASRHPANPAPVYLVIRTDDAGMSHSVNMAVEKLIASGLPVSVSVMFPTPWYQETVDILKRHPEVSVGIHLTLNSEWKNYRWGPVLGRTAVPSLVDADGYFFASAEALHQNHPNIQEVEKELRAQIQRALGSGLKIDYVDYHMGTVVRYPEFRELTERLASGYPLQQTFHSFLPLIGIGIQVLVACASALLLRLLAKAAEALRRALAPRLPASPSPRLWAPGDDPHTLAQRLLWATSRGRAPPCRLASR